MISTAEIKLLDRTIPNFEFKGKMFYLSIEDFMQRIVEKLPNFTHVKYYEGWVLPKDAYTIQSPNKEDVTDEDIKKYIVANTSDWVLEDE